MPFYSFADYIVKHVSEEKHDVFLDGVGWEGGDEWIRTQFKIYLLCLMRTSMLQGKASLTFFFCFKEYDYKMYQFIQTDLGSLIISIRHLCRHGRTLTITKCGAVRIVQRFSR